ncbi:hypothetical protein OSB04_027855 [Centaurea solstitialis]|uniref:Protein kinase domain-containing protein n=1 Tax=Centaurea solstitialis TaxID=347529 RepID=A0AA38SEE2_9ASTR|nr:hypothetical protein OSB04_027855 [Centaurea solstitialis]
MKLSQISHLLILLSFTTLTTALKYSKPGCKDTCGKVMIPYPFGIGVNCSFNEWYVVDCNSSKPYLRALNYLEVLKISLANQTVTINAPTIYGCQNQLPNRSQMIPSIDLGKSPFLFSKSHNKFVLEGCGNAFIFSDRESVLAGCSTSCGNESSTISERNSCLGINCCQTQVPQYLKSYSLNVKGSCSGSAFLVDENSYAKGISVSGQSIASVPISLTWTLRDGDFGSNELTCCQLAMPILLNLDLADGTSMESWKCLSDNQPLAGNLYLEFGCDVNQECARCKKGGGYCFYDVIYNGDGFVSRWNFSCSSPAYPYSSFNYRLLIVGIPIIIGLLLFIPIIYVSYRAIQKRRAKSRRKRFFRRMGDLLLKQQEEADPSLFHKSVLFTSRELEKATDHFNENRILGKGGQGTVYKGMLADGRIVAVKKSKVVDESQFREFVNEVIVLSQVSHRNVVKLLGCCLDTEVPLLVSEFISNGTLYDRIHNETDEFPISLNMRLQIATEIGGALAYLHSSTSIPIYHRDIKTTNILLDDKYRAKVSDFGTSRFVSIDQTHLTTLVKGTFGYLDPEYFQSSQFTEKSDVYSFGVVLVELLTGERPISLTRFGENRSLVAHFMLAMEEGRVMSIFDALVIKEGTRDELLAVANLAMRCLNSNGKNRPTMKEVEVELESIRLSHIPFTVQNNCKEVMYQEEIQMVT